MIRKSGGEYNQGWKYLTRVNLFNNTVLLAMLRRWNVGYQEEGRKYIDYNTEGYVKIHAEIIFAQADPRRWNSWGKQSEKHDHGVWRREH